METLRFVDFSENQSITEAENNLLQHLQDQLLFTQSFEEVMQQLWDGTADLLPRDRLGLAFIEDDGQRVVSRYVKTVGVESKISDSYSSGLANSSLESILESKKARIINDLEEYLKSHPQSESTQLLVSEEIHSSLTIPLILGERAIGFLFFSSCQKGIFSKNHVFLLFKIASVLSHTIEKAWLIYRLEESKKQYATMIGFVAHEMKSPLTTVMSMGYAYIDGVYGEIDKSSAEIISKMVHITGYMVNMVGNYLNISRLDSGEMQFKPLEDIPFRSKILDFALEVVQARIQEFGSQVNIKFPAKEAFLECDPDLLQIVMINLIDNAVKYGFHKSEIEIDIQLIQSRLIIRIKNQGVGFLPEQAKSLFKKFSRLRQKGLEDRRGTGLGLYLTWWIIQKHGGIIKAESEPGSWAEFTVELPKASFTAINAI